jgi:hypothetical protein
VRRNQLKEHIMQRITDAHLLALCQRLNAATNSPQTYADEHKPGVPFRSCIGHWHINHAYGGVMLARVHNEHGGIESFGGYGTKRQCAERIRAMLDALALREGGAA